MKRFFFTAITLAAVAVGCTKSGLLESPKTYEDPISFEPYTGKATMTKATVVKTEHIETAGFSVIGFEETTSGLNATPYLNKDVTKGDNGWTYDGAMYWPDGSELTFVAFGNNALDNVTYPVGTDYTKLTYVVPTAATAQKDLVISPVKPNCTSTKPNGIDEENAKAVSVRLYHALSRVGFKVKTIGVSGVAVSISDITMRGEFVTSGTFDLTAINIEEEKKKTLAYTLSNPAKGDVAYPLFASGQSFTTDGSLETGSNEKIFDIVPSTDANDRFMMIMPGTVGNVTDTEDIDNDGNKTETVSPYIKVVYTLTGANQQTAIIPLLKEGNNFEFEIGKAYEFVFTVSTQAVGFDVQVGIWQPTNGNEDNPQTVPDTETFPLN